LDNPFTVRQPEMNRMNQRWTALVALALATFGWALSPVFIRYLKGPYDPYSQATLRYASAAAFLMVYSLILHRGGLRQAFAAPGATLGLAAMNVLLQATWTAGLYLTTATIGQLIVKIQVPMVIVLSFLVFREERAIIRSPWFVLGTLISILGAAGVLLEDVGAAYLPRLDWAVALLLVSALSWSVYAVWGKRTVARRLNAIPMFTVVALYTTLGLGLSSLLLGDPSTILEAPASTTMLAIFSGILPIAVAHSAFHYAQKHLGSAFCGSILLLNPLLTHGLALMLWTDEAMIWIQWVGAAALLGGSAMVIRAGRKAWGDER
jgi:drug/metabolite transporter (DMT)-like permease